MPKSWVFDHPNSLVLNEARQGLLRTILPELKVHLGLHTALDAGCGVGYFSSFVRELGFQVTSFDGRPENVEEAQRRWPEVQFFVANAEDPALRQLAAVDLVLCVGLLYHLENPFAAMRNFASLAAKVLIIESMCIPGDDLLLSLRDENLGEDQGLQYTAMYPTEASIIKMCYRVGFPFVYRLQPLPNHDDFQDTARRRRTRTMICASKVPLQFPFLSPAPEPTNAKDPWQHASAGLQPPVPAKVPGQDRLERLRRRYRFKQLWHKYLPRLPLPVRLPFGGWWLAWNDVCSDLVFTGCFEEAEQRFVDRFLKPGMTVLDIGAHHGFYTLAAARKVGAHGQVIAFEPSPRERKKLTWHLRLNRCRNVRTEALALGNQEGTNEFFMVEGRDTGCNSLRPPNVAEPTKREHVAVSTLDSYLRQLPSERIDFIKMDVEGAELDVLKGATALLQRQPRPVWLIEVQDIRTQPWGYRAKNILKFLHNLGYRWFQLQPDGAGLTPLSLEQDSYQGNYVAVPREQLEQQSLAEKQHEAAPHVAGNLNGSKNPTIQPSPANSHARGWLRQPGRRNGSAPLPKQVLNLSGSQDIGWSFLAAHIPQGTGDILDFGSGNGYMSLLAGRRGYRVIALDVEPQGVAWQHANIRCMQGDLSKAELQPGQFDMILNCSTLEHTVLMGNVERPDSDLETMARLRELIKPGGVMLLTIFIGQDTACSPPGRVYGSRRLPCLLAGFHIEHEEYWVKDPDNKWVLSDRHEALQYPALFAAGEPLKSISALGCFVLRCPEAKK